VDDKPARLKWRSEVAASHPEREPEWRAVGLDVALGNPKYGALWHVVVCAPDGTPHYDLPVMMEPGTGAVIVATDTAGRIAMVECYRAAVRVPGAATRDPLDLPPNLDDHGLLSLELPRGYAEAGESGHDAARREAREELGMEVGEPELIGWHNHNTTLYGKSVAIFFVPLTGEPTAVAPDPRERIRRVLFLSLADVLARVQRGEIFCGVTKSALLTYLATVASPPLLP
jgi:8-oxo-dGTP pyrophosphatase MutT (NUDIX family)